MRYREHADETDDGDGVLDMSIAGDEEEQHRIELEHNLQDLSIQLSLSNPSHASDQEGSVERSEQNRPSGSSFELEYPRHTSHRQNDSFLDNTQFRQNMDSNIYSYRFVDDDAEVHYVNNTMSTPAHHASIVTLSAGLGRRSGKPVYAAESSLSGAEYDPDRPLDSVLNGVADELSLLNMDNTRTRGKGVTRMGATQTQVAFDPLVVDHDISAIVGIDRSYNKTRNTKHADVPGHSASFHFDRSETLKTKMRVKRPTFDIHPPTPSSRANATGNSSATQGSKFTRLAKSLAREIEASQRWTDAAELENLSPAKPSRKKQNAHRSPFKDVMNHLPSALASMYPSSAQPRPVRPVKKRDTQPDLLSKHDRSQSKLVCLPDVTGLTSAVASPPRREQNRRAYAGGSEGERVETELVKTLTALQTRLNQLESQNLVSRRRIQELELELEACKLDVKRERTRVMEREDIIVAQQKDFQKQRNALTKAAQRLPDPKDDEHYKEVVEEKKALESLVVTLRSHLARLTSELSNQKSQLDELHSLRRSDLQNLHAKIAEVDALRLEVERLGGEIEILRGVVEEGLNQRRKAKEYIDLANDSKASAFEAPFTVREEDLSCAGQNGLGNDYSRPEFPSPPPSRPQSRQQDRPYLENKRVPFRVEETDPSQRNVHVNGQVREKGESRRTAADAKDCLSDKSASHIVDAGLTEAAGDRQERADRPTRIQAMKGGDSRRVRRVNLDQAALSRTPEAQVESETPFPQIRGSRLERLFFSAPEHNEKTCRVCHRHRRRGASEDDLDFPSWLPPRKRAKLGREDGRHRHRGAEAAETAGLECDAIDERRAKIATKVPFSEDRLPPQTVLVRVLRELEDDFTHYKGIYVELADQYKLIDAASNVAKRNVLAEHLREVIDTLEQKGDQIASLYDLLTFQDKPVKESAVPERRRGSHAPRSPRPFRQFSGKHHEGLRKSPTYS